MLGRHVGTEGLEEKMKGKVGRDSGNEWLEEGTRENS